jgi:hypothetical protein
MVPLQFLPGGADLTAIALVINRIALGAFFTTSAFHKLFNRERHAVFVRELVSDRVPRLGFNQWFVPSIESFGGLAAKYQARLRGAVPPGGHRGSLLFHDDCQLNFLLRHNFQFLG